MSSYVTDMLDRGERIMGFGHRVYRAYDPRATVLKRTAQELSSPRVEVAAALEDAVLKVLRERSPDRQLETNVEYWAAVVLDYAQIPPDLTPAMFGCARVAGWSAHILEQKRTGRLIRPGGPLHRPAATHARRDRRLTMPPEEVCPALRSRRCRDGDVLDRSGPGHPHVPRLRHRRPRGAPTYEEVAYLLLYGELPASEQLDAFHEELSERDLPRTSKP